MATTAQSMSEQTAQLFSEAVIPNYGRYPVCLERGEGSRVWDDQGRSYLDLFPGWGCNLLGHCPPRVVKAIQDQAAKLIHVPNTWYTEAQGRWAKMLSERSFGGQAFFCNSGAEANEAAIKLIRLHTPAERYKIITFQGGFHGRTIGAVTATAQPKYHEGLGPLMAGFNYAPFGDLDAVRNLIDDETAGILIEPIQGEGGVRIPPAGFLQGLREIADEHDVLLAFDEVQAGCGRTGEWFAYQHASLGGGDATPDIMTLAKSLCGGVAGGAMLTTPEIAPSLRPGMHASTFGGNPIAAAAGIATLETIEAENLLDRAKEISAAFAARLEPLVEKLPYVEELRVCGLMIGLELSVEGTKVVQQCMERGLLINCTQGTVIRLLPAMNLTDADVEEGCDILINIIENLEL
ncbi:Acetylornithine aminotransferase [Posidoniimonas polymericola]|uniref:Acetylornithine aminotransferase n=1 Tax=Posidoniimonas polymericola TaxID=2528002 RepID=A0A5C5YIE1_9BACT|nr:aspartate aminotransferase family protein [Posidoniimonas polymericola]TWT74637.1 Acetylornithine aminotransferase [Posidoniimonas polymericola]